MIKEIKSGFIVFLFFMVLSGFLYPLFITGVAQVIWNKNANGSLIIKDSRVVGSELIGQEFKSPAYFHGRPSSVNYAGNKSGATNLGPTSKKLSDVTRENVLLIRNENGLSVDTKIPSDLTLGSASGLDPHISIEAAKLQVPRIASMRNLPKKKIEELLNKHIESEQFGILGKKRVNVLELNIDLDKI
jgi:K+-transporting ATPase ATPase C chain